MQRSVLVLRRRQRFGSLGDYSSRRLKRNLLKAPQGMASKTSPKTKCFRESISAQFRKILIMCIKTGMGHTGVGYSLLYLSIKPSTNENREKAFRLFNSVPYCTSFPCITACLFKVLSKLDILE